MSLRRASIAETTPRWAFRWALTAVLLLALPAPAQALERGYYFTQYDNRDGLSQTTVTAMLQDDGGMVWVATQNGLHRFHGYRFIPVEEFAPEGDPMPPSFVTALAQDAKGRMWVGSERDGIHIVDVANRRIDALAPQLLSADGRPIRIDALLRADTRGMFVAGDGKLWQVQPGTAPGQAVALEGARSIEQLALDAKGRLWAATDAGLFRIDTRRGEAIRVLDEPFHDLQTDREGRFWAVSARGLSRVDGEAGTVAEPEPLPLATHEEPIALTSDADGRLWLSLRNSDLMRYDPTSGEILRVGAQPEIDGGLKESGVPYLFVDRSNLLWLGGRMRGVATASADGAAFPAIFDTDLSGSAMAPGNYIRSLAEDEDGSLWIGSAGDGVKRYDSATGRFQRFDEAMRQAAGSSDPNAPLQASGIVQDAKGRIFASSSLGLFQLDRTSGRAMRMGPDIDGSALGATALLLARDGSLWTGILEHGLARFEPDTGAWTMFGADPGNPEALHQDRILALHEDDKGRIWIAGVRGVDVHDPAGEGFIHFAHSGSAPASLSHDIVRSIAPASHGALWLGTHGGLDRIDEPHPGQFVVTHVDAAAHLSSGPVYGVVEDAAGLVWLSGHEGLTRFDPGTGQTRRYGLESGLQDLEFNGNAQLRLTDGRIAFGGIRGINLFDPARVQHSHFEAPVVITSVHIGGVMAAFDPARPDRLEMPQEARTLRLSFAALDFFSPQNNQFAYRLEGFDPEFIESGNLPHASYTNLPPGDYLFRVRGANSDGVWNEKEATLALRIVPAWWNSTLARIGYAALALLLLGALFASYRNRQRQRLNLLEQIQERENRLKMALWGSGDEFWIIDVPNWVMHRIGANFVHGAPQADQSLTHEEWMKAAHPEDGPRVQQLAIDHLEGRAPTFESEHRMRNARGECIWIRARGKVVERDAQGNPLRMAGIARNVTSQRHAEREHRIAAEVLRCMSEAMCVTDLDFRVVQVNPAFSRMTGYSESEITGQSIALLQSTHHNEDFYLRQREDTARDGHWRGEMWQQRKDAEEFLSWFEFTAVVDSAGQRTHYVGVLTDITEKKRAEQELRYLANYDTLTGLPNRSLLTERLARAVVRARRHESMVAVLFLDLDRFKDINDTLGHAAGDRILKASATRLLSVVTPSETVARLGGDEFTVVMEDIIDESAAIRAALTIMEAFSQPLEIEGGGEQIVTPSIGISLYPNHALIPTDLLKFADTAMYRAKERGRNTYQIYDQQMDAEARRRTLMTAALRRAMDRGELHLQFQPRLSLVDGRIGGVEALLRWRCEELGEVTPTEFIPLAEETGLILPIGEWVLNEACRTLRHWSDIGINDLSVAVNVSVLQLLRGNLPETLQQVLTTHGVPAHRLELELTESMVMANAEQAISALQAIKRTGVSLAIDDFGTGYSSLVYLKRLPIDTLKIDKEFVRDLNQDPDDEAITATIITMAHSLGLNVIAEGVETEEQLNYLREHGCDEIQGYWLSRPMPASDCIAYIRRYRANTAVTEPEA